MKRGIEYQNPIQLVLKEGAQSFEFFYRIKESLIKFLLDLYDYGKIEKLK